MNMHYAFIDESERGTDFFFLTALIVDAENLHSFNTELDLLITRSVEATNVALKPTAELHGYDMMQQKRDWKGQPLRFCISVYRRALKITQHHAAALYTEGIDRKHLENRYGVRAYAPRDLAINYLLERVNEYCFKKNDTAIAIFDDHYTAPEGRKNFVRYQQEGTFGYRSSRLTRIEKIDFCDSKSIRALQASDLCCYAINRSLTCCTANHKTIRTQKTFMEEISPLIKKGRVRIWP